MRIEAPQGMISVSEVLSYLAQDRYLCLSEACSYLSLSERTIRELLPEINHYRIGRKILFKKSELDSWVMLHQETSEELDLDVMAEAAMNDLLRAG